MQTVYAPGSTFEMTAWSRRICWPCVDAQDPRISKNSGTPLWMIMGASFGCLEKLSIKRPPF
jgi:hypothetical protein